MAATFILTTSAEELHKAWARQLPDPPAILSTDDALAAELLRPGARVWIKDIRAEQAGFEVHSDTVVVAVGEPRSVPFENARQDRSVAYCLSYDESERKLGDILQLASDLAEARSVISLVNQRPPPSTRSANPFPESSPRGSNELEFIEAALDHLDDLRFIVDVFKRGIRARSRAASVAIFLREKRHFRAEAEQWDCPVSDPIVVWLQEHAAIVDAEALTSIPKPIVEVFVRQKMAAWNARLLLPIQVHGTLEGWVCFGPRADARPHSQSDREDALMIVSILSCFIGQHRRLNAAIGTQTEARMICQHGPKFRVLGQDPVASEALPVEVREVVSLARKDGTRVNREFGRLRVSAGLIPGGQNVWVLWDHDGAWGESLARRLEEERFRMLHDLGLVMSHELANAMFSVSTYFQHVRKQPEATPTADAPGTSGLAGLLAQVDKDMVRLKEMPHILETVYEMGKKPTAVVEMRRLIQTAAKEVDGVADVNDTGVTIWGHEEHLRSALVWLCREIIETRNPETALPASKIKLRLQQRHRDDTETICLVSIAYPGLRLDQIKIGEAENVSEFPTTAVYLAREVIRFHYGTIQIGQGMDGPELYVSLKSRPNAPTNKAHEIS